MSRTEGDMPRTEGGVTEQAPAGEPEATSPQMPPQRTVVRPPFGESEARARIEEVRRRYGGLDAAAGLVGMLAAMGTLVVASGIAAAVSGTIAFRYESVNGTQQVATAALVAGGIALFVSFFVGGWAAGRMARYSGALNGFMTGVWFIVLGGALAALGALVGPEYNPFHSINPSQVRMPDWFSGVGAQTSLILTSVAAVVLVLLAGLLGGAFGQRMHRRADAVLVHPSDEATYRPSAPRRTA
jgi:hypothetical protein